MLELKIVLYEIKQLTFCQVNKSIKDIRKIAGAHLKQGEVTHCILSA